MEIKQDRFEFMISYGDIDFLIRATNDSVGAESSLNQLPHMHYYTEFHYIYEGTEKLRVSDKNADVILHPGDFCIIPPDLYHGTFSDAFVKRYCFNMSISFRHPHKQIGSSEYFRMTKALSTVKAPMPVKDEYITYLMNSFSNLPNERYIISQKGIILLNVVIRIFNIIYAHNAVSGALGVDRNTSRLSLDRKWIIEEYIATHYASPDGISGLAGYLYLSERRTRTLVRSIMGSDFKSLIINQRLSVADILIKSTDQTLESISHAVGYRTYSGFFQAYRRFYGYTPEKSRSAAVDDAMLHSHNNT